MHWTDEALALLVILRGIIADRAEVARFLLERDPRLIRHYRLAVLALNLVEVLITSTPTILVLDPADFVPYGVLMFIDAMIGALRDAGTVNAGITLQRLGWRIRRAGAYYSPNAYQHSWGAPHAHGQERTSHYSPTPAPGYAGKASYYSPTVTGEGAPARYSPTRGGGRGTSFESPETGDTPKPRPTFHSPRAK